MGQMLQMFSRFEFQKAIKETKTEYHSRGFRSWNHFVSMLFGQLSGQDSLRCIEAGLASQAKTLYHLGVRPVHRSTLSYANAHRSHELFKKIFEWMLSKCQPLAPKHKFRFKNPLYSIDATTIDLCLSLFNWAKFRTTKGAVKLHVKLTHSGYLPIFAIVTTGKEHEQKVVPRVPLEKGDVVVIDRAFTNFTWFASLCERGIYFVTRLKKNADYRVVERRDTKHLKNISSDQIIEFKGFYTKQKIHYRLRRIRSRDPETGKYIVLLTNQFEWSAKTIAQIYKDRWQIELFFKALKQQLKVKSFVGTSKNALLSQLWVALIAYLLLCYLKFKSKLGLSLCTLCSILPTNLFSRRNLWDWLNAPFHAKSNSPPGELQYELSFC
jgi:putative transposase